MVLPFVFGSVIGIKSLLFVVEKDDFKSEKIIKNNLNEIAENIFQRLYIFFIISLMVFFVLVLDIDTQNYLIRSLLKIHFINSILDILKIVSKQAMEFIICLSFFYFGLILIDIYTIIQEIIHLNKVKNKV